MKNELTKLQTEEIEALANMPDEKIDKSDIPEVKDWSLAEIGKSGYPLYSSDESSYPWTRAVGGEDRVC